MKDRVSGQIAAFGLVAVVFFGATLGAVDGALASQKRSRAEQSPPNPLEETAPDPLLPEKPKNGMLAPEERDRLRTALDELNVKAAAELAGGNTEEAFEIWNRELRLRRYLGSLEEIEALARVGAVAWNKQLLTQVQIIAQRLEEIQIEYCSSFVSNPSARGVYRCDLEMLEALAKAYQAVVERSLAVAVYEEILANARNRRDIPARQATLKTIARLQLERLDYAGAAVAYEELLALAEASNDRSVEIGYVLELARVYARGRQFEQAIAMRQRLVQFYTDTEELRRVPELQLAIAVDYQTLGRDNKALPHLRAAYKLAWSLQQFYLARVALEQIGTIYSSRDRLAEALQVYQALLIVDRRAYNLYGMMNTYDQIGQIYKLRQDYPQALAAFQKGLELARKLGYRAEYFAGQIEQIVRVSSPE